MPLQRFKNKTMKLHKNITILILLICIVLLLIHKLGAQNFFENTNHEACMELYKDRNYDGEFIVYLVLDSYLLDTTDIKFINKLSKFNETIQKIIIDKWNIKGKRIEIENYPCIMYKINKPQFLLRK